MGLPGSEIADAIRASGITIYDSLEEQPGLVYDIDLLEARLNAGLTGLRLDGPLRTRGKRAKEIVAELLGYPIPATFKRTQPRFPGQHLDIFVQKSLNLQIWNEEADATRRYALIRVDAFDIVTRVRVLTGSAIAEYDRTGTLTSKYQAKRKPEHKGSLLVTPLDTDLLRAVLQPVDQLTDEQLQSISPIARPVPALVLSIATVYERLASLVGTVLVDPGELQDRARGVALQRAICTILGLGDYADVGQFPDILSQALEVKLQMSPTIDLGLVAPSSGEPAEELGDDLRHCDVRYAVVYGEPAPPAGVLVTGVVVATGEHFFDEFQLFGGLVQNRKLQIPLPASIFEAERSPD